MTAFLLHRNGRALTCNSSLLSILLANVAELSPLKHYSFGCEVLSNHAPKYTEKAFYVVCGACTRMLQGNVFRNASSPHPFPALNCGSQGNECFP